MTEKLGKKTRNEIMTQVSNKPSGGQHTYSQKMYYPYVDETIQSPGMKQSDFSTMSAQLSSSQKGSLLYSAKGLPLKNMHLQQ